MNANHCHDIDDASSETFYLLSDLIEASLSDEQLIYREAEIDELWRLLVAYQKLAKGDEAARMTAVIDGVMQVHDMLDGPAHALAAARQLRQLGAW